MAKIYCLDANVLIQAWQKYYSPKFCPDYWEILNELGKEERIFIPEMVKEEITRTEDDLSKWLKKSKISIHKMSAEVIDAWQTMLKANPTHKLLVDNIKNRSLADPWVIAHALNQKATVVTKEEKVTALNSSRIKIPNVCDNMNVRWINDFQFIEELGIQFNCKRK
jgi:predicted nucleic acid-binding protein